MTQLGAESLGRVDEMQHVDMLIYGDSKAGKTFCAATAPQPLYVAAVDPTGHKSIPYETPGKRIRTVEDLRGVITGFYSGGHGYRTLLIDGMTFLHDLFVKEAGVLWVEKYEAKDPDLLPIAGRMKIISQWKAMMRGVLDLTQLTQADGSPSPDRCHVVCTTLAERVKESEDAPFLMRPSIGTAKINEITPAFFSVIAYIQPKEGTQPDGSLITAREMLFTKFNRIMAGDRLGIFPTYLEGDPVNLSEYLK